MTGSETSFSTGNLNAADLWLFTVWLLLGVPLLGRWAHARLTSLEKSQQRERRVRTYLRTLVKQWLTAAAVVWIALHHHVQWSEIGLGRIDLARTVGTCAALTATLAIVAVLNLRQIRGLTHAQLGKAFGRMQPFYPDGRFEHGIFVVLAATAGICEELIYRGLLLNFLGAVSRSLWTGVLLSSAVFGLGHAYQGRKGVIATSILGLVFAGIYVFTRSLYAGQLLHFMIDVTFGFSGAYGVRLLRDRAPPSSRPVIGS
ncbi:MAG: CPBP family intramembrane glutamic endopeptidase [Steroidobacteraceae bacterium]